MLLGGQTTEFQLNIYSFCPLCHTLVLVLAFWPSFLIGQKPHAPFTGEACETNHKNWKLLEKKITEQLCHTDHSNCASFNLVPVCLGALHGHPPSNSAKWRCQASHEWGKMWSGWNRTNQAGGYTALCIVVYLHLPSLDPFKYNDIHYFQNCKAEKYGD